MKKDLLIIKLGGSVITYKDSNLPKPRIKVINRLAREIKKIFDINKYQIILVHGAGSFAHPLAKKYNLSSGIQTQEQILGFAETAQAMIKLNSLIVEQLIKQKIPAVAITPRSIINTKSRKIDKFDTHSVELSLKQGLIPVLFGDVVFDTEQNTAVLSGDTIISYLTHILHPKKIIFLSDVDGIFDSNPKKNPNAKLIKEINDHNLRFVLEGVSQNNVEDVTGEMKGKIEEIRNSLKNTDVFILNGLKPQQLEKLLIHSTLSRRTKLLFS